MLPELSFADGFGRLTRNIEQFVHGNADAVRFALICLFAEGHLLIEGPPGVAKTSLAKALACSVSAQRARVQFTPDLLPSDLTGVRVFRQDSGDFRFLPGPVFTNILIADEINRSSPRTQSALLEVMGERQVSVDGTTYAVPTPFMCVATQNPLEYRGTFPLPEAQIDRFMMKVSMRPPDRAAELLVLDGGMRQLTPESTVEPELSLDEVRRMTAQVQQVHVSQAVMGYILDLVDAARQRSAIAAGVSPRAGIALALAARVQAISQKDRDYVCVCDVRAVAPPVLRHRLVPPPGAEESDPDEIIMSLIARTPVPVPADGAREGKRAAPERRSAPRA